MHPELVGQERPRGHGPEGDGPKEPGKEQLPRTHLEATCQDRVPWASAKAQREALVGRGGQVLSLGSRLR